jgi:hypothetical protein
MGQMIINRNILQDILTAVCIVLYYKNKTCLGMEKEELLERRQLFMADYTDYKIWLKRTGKDY